MPKTIKHRFSSYAHLIANKHKVIVHKAPEIGYDDPWEVWHGAADKPLLATFKTHAEALAYAIKKAGL